jgi:HEAT repeat protein
MGKYTPWAQNHWAEEEKIADTLFTKKKNMTTMADAAVRAPVEQQQEAAAMLSEVASRDSVLLLRLHAIQQLSRLRCPGAIDALANSSKDHNSDVRLAAVKAWKSMPANDAIPSLQQMVGSDTSVDVRLAATRALGSFPGPQAVPAISLALNDPDPALQLRAVESLQLVTGKPLGRNVKVWQNYVANVTPASEQTAPGQVDGSELRQAEFTADSEAGGFPFGRFSR